MFTASSASRRRFLDPSAPIVLRTPVSWGSEPPVPQAASDSRHHPSTTAPRRFFLQELRACQKASAFTFCFQISRAKLIYPTQSICLSSGVNLSHFACSRLSSIRSVPLTTPTIAFVVPCPRSFLDANRTLEISTDLSKKRLVWRCKSDLSKLKTHGPLLRDTDHGSVNRVSVLLSERLSPLQKARDSKQTGSLTPA